MGYLRSFLLAFFATMFAPAFANACIGSYQWALAVQTAAQGQNVVFCQYSYFPADQPLVLVAPNQQVYTEGEATGDARALIVVSNPMTTTVINNHGHETTTAAVQVRNLRINGSRSVYGGVLCSPTTDCSGTISLGGAGNIVIAGNELWDARGWTNIALYKGVTPDACHSAQIIGNVVRDSGSTESSWADGISVYCHHTRIYANFIYDVSDGGIVLFGAHDSLVDYNTIQAISRDMFLGVGLTDYADAAGDFTNVVIRNNNFIASTYGFMYTGVAAGTRIWFGNDYGGNQNRQFQVFDNNFTGPYIGHVIPVSGAYGVAIYNNNISTDLAYYPWIYDQNNVTASYLPNFSPVGNMDWLIYAGRFTGSLYRHIMGRTPEHGGYMYWTSRIVGSQCTRTNLKTIFDENLWSSEVQNRFEYLDNASIVTYLYRLILRREPDSGGLSYWAGTIRGGPWSDKRADISNVAANIFLSSEFRSGPSDEYLLQRESWR